MIHCRYWFFKNFTVSDISLGNIPCYVSLHSLYSKQCVVLHTKVTLPSMTSISPTTSTHAHTFHRIPNRQLLSPPPSRPPTPTVLSTKDYVNGHKELMINLIGHWREERLDRVVLDRLVIIHLEMVRVFSDSSPDSLSRRKLYHWTYSPILSPLI